MTDVPDEVRDRLALALDVDDLIAARRLARSLRPWFGVAKVGLELYTAAGPEAVAMIQDLGYEVFLDLKFHDIPTTVGRASRVAGSLGVRYLTVHAFGGTSMLAAAVDGLRSGAAEAGAPDPVTLAVTVLTSDDGAPAHILPKRIQAALEGGCQGVVCAASDVTETRHYAPRMKTVVPGIRMPDSPADDQARRATPSEAFRVGADLLVIGRAVTQAQDPAVAAAALVETVLDAVS